MKTRTLKILRNCVPPYHRTARLRMRSFDLKVFFFNFQKKKKFVEETSNFSMVGHRRKLRSPSMRRNPRGWQLAQRGINRPTPVSVHPSTPSPHYGLSYSPTAVSRHSARVHFERQREELKNKLPKILRFTFSLPSIEFLHFLLSWTEFHDSRIEITRCTKRNA